MDGGGIRQRQLVQLCDMIDYRPAIKPNCQCPLFLTDLFNGSDVSIEDLFLIVVANLHDTVCQLEDIAASSQTQLVRVQGRLLCRIQTGGSNDSFLHWSEHLNLSIVA